MSTSTNTADHESCLAVEKELDRVINKFNLIRESAAADITDVATLLEELTQALGKAEQEMVSTSTQVDVAADIDMDQMEEEDMHVEMERECVCGAVALDIFCPLSCLAI